MYLGLTLFQFKYIYVLQIKITQMFPAVILFILISILLWITL